MPMRIPLEVRILNLDLDGVVRFRLLSTLDRVLRP